MTTMARIVVIGDLMTDTVAHATLPLARGSDTPAKVTTHGGGSGANVAAWLGADGADVAFIGRRGADLAGRNRDMELMGYSVDARLVMDPERPTGTCVVMVTHKGERTMLSDPGANSALSPDDLPHDLFVPGAHLHVSGYTLLSEGSRAAALAALDFAGRVGMSTSVDGASAAPLERVGAEPFFELTGNALLLFVNVAQARVLTGRDDPEAAARVLTAWYPQVVIKLAENGALFFANGRPPVRVPAPPVERVIDGTGAGDAFIAGFLPPWQDKKPPMEALASGCRLAAHALNLIGARPILLSPGDVPSAPRCVAENLRFDAKLTVCHRGRSLLCGRKPAWRGSWQSCSLLMAAWRSLLAGALGSVRRWPPRWRWPAPRWSLWRVTRPGCRLRASRCATRGARSCG